MGIGKSKLANIYGADWPFETQENIFIAKVDIHTQRSCCYDIVNMVVWELLRMIIIANLIIVIKKQRKCN